MRSHIRGEATGDLPGVHIDRDYYRRLESHLAERRVRRLLGWVPEPPPG